MKKRNLLRVVLCVLLVSSMLLNVLATGTEPVVTGSGTAEDPTHTSVTESTSAGTGELGGETTVDTTNTTISGETENADGSTTTVTGSETTVVTTERYDDGSTAKVTGAVTGSQDTTTKKVDTEDNVLIYDNTNDPEDVTPENNVQILDDDADPVKIGESSDVDWDNLGEDDVTWSESGWKNTEKVSDEKEEGKTDAQVPDPLKTQDVTINLLPDGQAHTATLKVSVADVIAANGNQLNPYHLTADSAPQEVTLEDGTVATVRPEVDKNGELIGYTISTPNGDKGKVIHGNLDNIEFGASTPAEPILPEKYTGPDFVVQKDGSTLKSVGEETSEAGKTETKVTGIRDKDDNVTEYVVTKTNTKVTTTPETIEENDETAVELTEEMLNKLKADLQLDSLPDAADGDLVKTKITPPTKPEVVPEYEDEDGNIIKTTVEEAVIDGIPVYITKVVKTDKDNNELETHTTTLYGTVQVSVYDPVTMERKTTTTVTDVETIKYTATAKSRVVGVTQQQTVHEDTYILVPTENGVEVVYTGTMSVVDASVSGINKLSIIPDSEYLTPEAGSDGLSWKHDLQGNLYNTKQYTGYMANDAALKNVRSQLKDGEYALVGYGMLASYNIFDDQGSRDSGTGAHLPTQYVVTDKDGKLYYGYCVELGKRLLWNDKNETETVGADSLYREKDLASYDEENNVYFNQGSAAISKLSSVANNGFWGTTSGIGSLDTVKQFIEDNKAALLALDKGFTEEDIDTAVDSLTEGQAMTATQAAIWTYGTNGTKTLSGVKDLIEYTADKNNPTIPYAPGDADYDNINVLYQLLTAVAEEEAIDGTAKMQNAIGKDDVSGGSIKLYDTVKDGKGNTQYNADVSFSLAMSKSSINGDLVLHVYANGDTTTPITTKRIADPKEGSSVFSNAVSEGISITEVNGETVITLTGLQLEENSNITLKLEGVQHLENGVYIYEAKDSQNFLGLASADRQMNMTITMNFDVNDPEKIKHTSRNRVQEREGTVTETVTEQWLSDTHTVTTEAERVTKVYADLTVTTTTDVEETWTKNWEESYPQLFEEENDPEEKKKEEEIKDEDVPLEDIFEEEIPLADVPKTGDGSAIWMVLSVLSALGLAVMFLFDRKRKEA